MYFFEKVPFIFGISAELLVMWNYKSNVEKTIFLYICLFSLGCMQNSLNIPQVGSGAIQGTISFLAESSSDQKMQASSCSDPKVYLYKIDEEGNRVEPELDSVSLGANYDYSFNLKSKNINFSGKTPKTPLVVQLRGCNSQVYSRPVTSLSEQNISLGSTVVTYAMNSSLKSKFVSVLQSNPTQIESLLSSLKDANSFQNAYEALSLNQNLASKFVQIFGAEPNILSQATPEIISEIIPKNLSELVSTLFSLKINHFNKNYSVFYEWKWDSQIIGNLDYVSFTPRANHQGKHILSVKIGEKDGNTFKDGNPTKTLSWAVEVDNNVRPTPPLFTLQNPVMGSSGFINTGTLTLAIQTGNQLENCNSFSYLALSETHSNEPPPNSYFSFSCIQNITQSLTYTLQSAAEGNKALYLWAKDASGTISSQPSILSISIDTISPTLTIHNDPTANTSLTNMTFSFSAIDLASGISHFECQLDNAGYSVCSSPMVLSGLGEGVHNFDVKAIDGAGNSSAVTRKTWVVDTVEPTLTLTSKPSGVTNNLSASFSFSSSDGGSGVKQNLCSWDGTSFEVCSSPVTRSLSPGLHQFTIKSTDNAENVSSILNYSWTVDVTAPTVNFTTQPLSLSNSTQATFSFAGVDTGGGVVDHFECKLNSASFSVCSSPITFSGLSAGNHSFQVRPIDTAGNVGTLLNYNWSVDLTTPLASINSGPNLITNQVSATFEFSANSPPGGNIVGYECRLDGGSWLNCGSPTSYSSLSSGAHVFSVRSIDNNNNRSSNVDYNWTVDLALPNLTVNSVPDTMTNNNSAAFSFQAVDTGGGSIANYQCKIDSSGFSNCSSPHTVTNLAEGAHNFYIKATDTAGNSSAVYNYTWTVDLTPPVLTLVSSPAPTDNSSSANFSFSINDNNANNIASTMCSLDGQAFQVCLSPKSYSSLGTGAHQLAMLGIDNAGNVSSNLIYSWTIDQTPPTVTVASRPNSFVNVTTASFSFSGADSGGGSIAQYRCSIDAGSYSVCSSPISYSALAQGVHTFNVKAIDSAGNSSNVSSETWTIDLVAPIVTISSPASNGAVIPVTQLGNYTIAGTCTESDTVVSLTGVVSRTLPCASGAWSTVLDVSSLSDGQFTVTVVQLDSAGNSSALVSRTLIKDSIAPSISINTIATQKGGSSNFSISWNLTEANTLSGSSFSVQLTTDGSTWQALSSVSAIAGNNSAQNYSLSSVSLGVLNTSSAVVRVSLTDSAGNSASASSNLFIIDSTPPVLSSVSINNGAAYAGSSVVNVQVNLSDALTSSPLYIKLAAAATGTNDCQSEFVDSGWLTWTSSTQNFSFTISPVDGLKKICVWGKDAVGNVTIMSPTSGTNNVNYSTIIRQASSPPQITSLNVYNTADSTNTYSLNQAVTVTWSASSLVGLDNNPIALAYSTNGTTWYDIFTKGDSSILSNVTWIGSLSNNPTSASGTYSAFTAPTTGYFIIKAVARDIAGNISVVVMSQPQNTGTWSVFAGSTDKGDNGSGMSAALYSDGASSGGRAIAINPKTNDLYTLDHGTGIRKLDIQTGKVTTFVPNGTLNLPVNGTLSSSSRVVVNGSSGMVIDSNGIMYYSNSTSNGAKIYKINLETKEVQFFAGGGTDNSTSATASSVYISPAAMELDASGNFYFITDCNTAAPTYLTAKKLMMSTLNADGTFGAVTALAGNCTTGTITYGQSALSQPLFGVNNYSQLSMIVAVNPNLVYVAGYGISPFKIVNGIAYSASIGTNSGVAVIAYNRKNNRIYRSVLGGSLGYFTPVNTSANGGETLVTVVSSTGSAGDCVKDGIDVTLSCVYVDSGPTFDSNGEVYFTDGIRNNAPNGFRIRYVDSNSQVRTIFGSFPFYGDGLEKGLIRGQIGGIYYKKSTEPNATAFPAGLYLVSPSMVFGQISESDSIYRTLWGNQQGNSYAAPTGTTISSSVSMGIPYAGGNGKALAFDSNGLPWMRASNQLVQVNSSNQIVVKANASGAWWENGGTPATSTLYVYGGYQNLALKGADGAFLIGGYFKSLTYNPTPQIRFLDFTNALNTKVMGGSFLYSQSTAMSADVTVAGGVQAAALYYGCINTAACSIQYVASQDRLYFLSSGDRYIRYISNPTNPALSTLTTIPTQVATSGIRNFIFKEDLSQIFLLDANGGLYCMDVNSGKAWCNNLTNLYPYTSTMGSFSYGANQMTWKDANTLLISNYKGQILQYILNP